MRDDDRDALSQRAQSIPRFRKERHLAGFSEDAFRDEVLRPLFHRLGFKDGRDLCGPSEHGKDTYFLKLDPFGVCDVHVVQTKKGNINLARKANQNLLDATTQLRTALNTKVVLRPRREKKLPVKAYLCTSGKINDAAKQHISSELDDPRLDYLDVDDLIPLLDERFPEVWFAIEPELRPYLKAMKRAVLDVEEDLLPGEGNGFTNQSAVSDEMFVGVQLQRSTLRSKKVKGKIERVPIFEELPVVGVLRRKERLVLVTGEGGAGKSTALRRLALVIIDRSLRAEAGQAVVPVFLKALSVAEDPDESLVEVCANETRRVTDSDQPSFTMSDLGAGNVTVLVDGLDELSSDEGRRLLLSKIQTFHREHPRCQVIVTSRESAFVSVLSELGSFARFQLSPISFRQAEQILRRIQKSRRLPVSQAQEVLRRLEQIHGLELNPLLVTVFAASTDYSRRDVPANITELFKKYTEMMLGRWDARKGLGQQYQAPLKDFILCQVGFEMHRRRVTSLEVEELSRLVEAELDRRGHETDVSELLDEIVVRSGLFRTVGDHVEFRHLLLQEFFAGRGVPSSDFLESVVSDQWWQRPIVFFFGQNPGDVRSLESLTSAVPLRDAKERFRAAVAIGLALQACYLVELKDKVGVFRWVIETLAAVEAEFVEALEAHGTRPLTAFVWYYLLGRDAAACSLPRASWAQAVERMVENPEVADSEIETRRFWLIAGMLENGMVQDAEEATKAYRPQDAKHWLGIHLGCFLLQHLRVADPKQKAAAKRIELRLQDKIKLLRDQLFKEFKSELLELQEGKPGEVQIRD